ncbi:MAG: 4-alpha-glucanotransferase, partial [Gammaproteobacteria bacterium]|nr:4-alpha-glucanotransferase [Gammaproteobacteria bacterium]
PSAIAMAPMQDYLGLGSEARFNIPGTTDNNWRWRLQNGALEPALVEWVAEQVEAASRVPVQSLNCAV